MKKLQYLETKAKHYLQYPVKYHKSNFPHNCKKIAKTAFQRRKGIFFFDLFSSKNLTKHKHFEVKSLCSVSSLLILFDYSGHNFDGSLHIIYLLYFTIVSALLKPSFPLFRAHSRRAPDRRSRVPFAPGADEENPDVRNGRTDFVLVYQLQRGIECHRLTRAFPRGGGSNQVTS